MAAEMPWWHAIEHFDPNGNHESLHHRIDFDVAILDEFPTVRWDWNAIKEKFGLSVWDYVWRYRELGWNWKGLTQYHKDEVDWGILREFSTMNWDWAMLLQFARPSEHERLYALMPERERPLFCTHEPMSWRIFVAHLNLPWNFRQVGMRDDVPWWMIVQARDVDWDWHTLSSRTDICWSAVVVCQDKDWNWKRLSGRRDIRTSVLPRLASRWHYGKLSRNTSLPANVRVRYWYLPWRRSWKERRVIAASTIQRWWGSMPHTLSCKNRLAREFDEMCEDMERCDIVMTIQHVLNSRTAPVTNTMAL